MGPLSLSPCSIKLNTNGKTKMENLNLSNFCITTVNCLAFQKGRAATIDDATGETKRAATPEGWLNEHSLRIGGAIAMVDEDGDPTNNLGHCAAVVLVIPRAKLSDNSRGNAGAVVGMVGDELGCILRVHGASEVSKAAKHAAKHLECLGATFDETVLARQEKAASIQRKKAELEALLAEMAALEALS
jgi:hypothetical protein